MTHMHAGRVLMRVSAGVGLFGLCLCLGATASSAQARGAGEARNDAMRTTSDTGTPMLMRRLSAFSADSMEGRGAGTAGGARARHWLERELRAIGIDSIGGSYEQPVHMATRAGRDSLGANVVARIHGRDANGPVIVLSAHYDHLGVHNGVIYNGADDNASGCVTLLTIAERFTHAPPLHDLILAFFDGEEVGLVGAKAFVAAPPVPLARIALNVNLDMVSRQDGGALWVSGTSHYPFLRPMLDAPAAGAKVTIRFGHDTRSLKPDDDWTNSSDHGAFHDRGIPFLYLGVEDHADYHKPGDDADKVNPLFYRGVTDFADALVRAVDASLARFPARH